MEKCMLLLLACLSAHCWLTESFMTLNALTKRSNQQIGDQRNEKCHKSPVNRVNLNSVSTCYSLLSENM